jgi:hypothetical protein
VTLHIEAQKGNGRPSLGSSGIDYTSVRLLSPLFLRCPHPIPVRPGEPVGNGHGVNGRLLLLENPLFRYAIGETIDTFGSTALPGPVRSTTGCEDTLLGLKNQCYDSEGRPRTILFSGNPGPGNFQKQDPAQHIPWLMWARGEQRRTDAPVLPPSAPGFPGLSTDDAKFMCAVSSTAEALGALNVRRKRAHAYVR